ncbi:hypothetical protein EVAR_32609_1 [Eumeta japonica]|uniref:Uncharacterized protein n=1 Tax=Eumeta variegata TaxID=151549 RepID=A0A4C1WJR3_EUMVA|nr:hypothetical protein EVAR_32609_1 [Eumeta japonica]
MIALPDITNVRVDQYGYAQYNLLLLPPSPIVRPREQQANQVGKVDVRDAAPARRSRAVRASVGGNHCSSDKQLIEDLDHEPLLASDICMEEVLKLVN